MNDNEFEPTVSIIVTIYNEETVVAEKIENLCALDYPTEKIEFLIGSDGSWDRTVEIASKYAHISNLRVYDLRRQGKVNTRNAILPEAKGEIIIFSDANTMYDNQAVKKMVSHFADPKIGCVSGQLRYKSGEKSVYWKYENWVRKQESKRGQTSGANRAIYGIRKGVIDKVRSDIINEDFYVATYALQSGWNVIMEPDAVAFEESNDDFYSQFKRHVQDGAGYYQAIAVFWRMLLPRKGNFVYISHRVFRWLVPLNLIVALISSGILAFYSKAMTVLFACQIFIYALLTIYYLAVVRIGSQPTGKIMKLISKLFYFMSVNVALTLGFVKLINKQYKATGEIQK